MKIRWTLLTVIVLSLVLIACGGGSDGGDPKKPVNDFFDGFAKMDAEKASNAVCKQYRDEFKAGMEGIFELLKSMDEDAKIEISGMKLEVKDKKDDEASITATAGTMKLVLMGQEDVTDLADQSASEPLKVVKEDGKWLICDSSFLEGFSE